MTTETPEPAGVDTAARAAEQPEGSHASPVPQQHPSDDRRPADAAFRHDDGGVIQTWKMDVFYGDFRAVADVSISFAANEISALIGPSGCGKSTVLRSLNRMNDLIPTARVEGEYPE